MTPTAPATIDKVDYTTTPHPSGVKALSLKDAPALIESLLPVQKLSIDVYKERMAGSGQTLTALGSYWKGRKPLVLNRACVLAALLPATDDPIKDLEVFELLMGMDDISISKRLGLPKPEAIVRTASISDIYEYFVVEPAGHQVPSEAPFEISDWPCMEDGRARPPRLRWRTDITETQKHEVAALSFAHDAYRNLASEAKRAEEIGSPLADHIWSRVNAHLGTRARSYPELVEQLGVMRFGHRPTVADTFSGSGQIPFAAAQLGCDVYASDLNPIACMLTWGALHLVGSTSEGRVKFLESVKQLLSDVRKEMDDLGFESDGNGWRGKAYLYCLEVECPSSGWRVPMLSSLLVCKDKKVILELIPNPQKKNYGLRVKTNASDSEVVAAARGTYKDETVSHFVDGVLHSNSIASIREDYSVSEGGRRVTKNKVRAWGRDEIVFAPGDTYTERLYAIQWVRDDGSKRPSTEYRSVTEDDLAREASVTEYVAANLADWKNFGWVPDMYIEVGGPPRYQGRSLIVNMGWRQWSHVFNPRQLLALSLFRKRLGAQHAHLFTRALDYGSRMSHWDHTRGNVQNVFYNQAINPIYEYGCRGLVGYLGLFKPDFPLAEVSGHCHVESHPAGDIGEPVDLGITDPPYGDAVKYEEILDLFISWLRKNPPDEFAAWTWDSRRELAIKGEDHDFRLSMVAAYKRMTECMPDNGLQVLMFTHQDGNIWADMANIVWASGLRVTAAWYLVTETDSALREGSYVKGTILLVLRKRLGAKRTNQTDLAYELEEEVAEQIKRLTGMNDTVTADSKRAKDGNLFEDADLQMAGYAAALKVLTKYSVIDGKEMAQEALRPRLAGQKTLVESLIEFATDTANKLLVPLGLDEWVWHDLEPAERFYLKMLEQESHGVHKLDNYQNFAKAFAVRNFSALMASENANKAALKSAKEFGRSEMNQSSELFQTPTRAVLYALMDLQTGKDLDVVLKGLEQNVKSGAFYALRPMLVALSRYIAKKAGGMRPEEASAARVLADGIDNQRL